MLTAESLCLWRGEQWLLDGLSFAVAPGRLLQVRGANGSGKTTLLRILCGLTRPESGQVSWQARPLASQRAEYGHALAYCGHHTGLKSDLSLAGNLAFAARLAGIRGAPWSDWLAQLGLANCANRLVRYLSAGQQRRGALARTLMLGRPLWILDEPFTNLDSQGREWLEDRLDQHLARGGLAVVAAHHELRPRAALERLALGDPP